MKKSCRNINIRDTKTIRPSVSDCIRRHMGRYDFQKLLRSFGLPKEDYFRAKAGEKYLLDPVIDMITEEAAERISGRQLGMPPVCIEQKVDASTHKVRLIGKESPWQQIFDCIAVDAAQEIWDRRIVPQQASSIKGRGQLYGVGTISGWIRSDNRAAEYARRHGQRYTRKCRYHVKIDIEQCYRSLRKDVFMKLFSRDCGNEDLIWLWDELLSSHRITLADGTIYEGFMIGARPSQTAAQYILSFVYRFAMSLHAQRRDKDIKLVSHMMMFMDDMILFSASRKNLREAVRQVIEFGREKFGLNFKDTWQIVRLAETPVDTMGFLVHADGNITVRPRVFLRVRRLALRVMRKGSISLRQALRACAYKGYFILRKAGRSFKAFAEGLKFEKAAGRLRLGHLFRIAQKVISAHDRRKNHGKDNIVQPA